MIFLLSDGGRSQIAETLWKGDTGPVKLPFCDSSSPETSITERWFGLIFSAREGEMTTLI